MNQLSEPNPSPEQANDQNDFNGKMTWAHFQT